MVKNHEASRESKDILQAKRKGKDKVEEMLIEDPMFLSCVF